VGTVSTIALLLDLASKTKAAAEIVSILIITDLSGREIALRLGFLKQSQR
jgi:hypothetical protein